MTERGRDIYIYIYREERETEKERVDMKLCGSLSHLHVIYSCYWSHVKEVRKNYRIHIMSATLKKKH